MVTTDYIMHISKMDGQVTRGGRDAYVYRNNFTMVTSGIQDTQCNLSRCVCIFGFMFTCLSHESQTPPKKDKQYVTTT